MTYQPDRAFVMEGDPRGMEGFAPPSPGTDQLPATQAQRGGNAVAAPADAFSVTATHAAAPHAMIPAHLLAASPTPKLNEAVAAVMAEMSFVEKRGRNTFHNYDYATADDLRAHVAHLLGKYGLSYEQHEISYAPVPFKRGEGAGYIAVSYAFRVCHKSGEVGPLELRTVLTMLFNNKGAPDDKAFSKAGVLALKDWAKSRFSIPTGDDREPAGGDDPDMTPEDHRQSRAPAPRFNTGSRVVDGVLARAEEADAVADGHSLLDAYLRARHEIEHFRGQPGWEGIVNALTEGVRRSLTAPIAAAFKSAVLASTPEHFAALEEAWGSRWAGTLTAMEADAPKTFDLLKDVVKANKMRAGVGQVQAAGGKPDGAAAATGNPTVPAQIGERLEDGSAITPTMRKIAADLLRCKDDADANGYGASVKVSIEKMTGAQKRWVDARFAERRAQFKSAA